MSILDLFKLTGKKAVVTGGARGIGQASAVAMAEAGADVFVIDLLEADETVEKIKKTGRNAYSAKADLTKEDEVNAVFAKARELMGTVDIVHNNAGIAYCVKCEDMSFDE